MWDSTRPPSRAPLPVLLQGRRGLGALQLIPRCQPFQRPQPPVFRHRNDDSGFTAQMDHLVRASPSWLSGLRGHTPTLPGPADGHAPLVA